MYNFLLFVVDCSFNFLRTKLDAKNTSFISTPRSYSQILHNPNWANNQLKEKMPLALSIHEQAYLFHPSRLTPYRWEIRCLHTTSWEIEPKRMIDYVKLTSQPLKISMVVKILRKN